MVSAIQEQRESMRSISSFGDKADDYNSNLGYHQGHHSRRCMSANPYIVELLTSSQWKVLVIDENAKKLIDNVVKEDDILNENIASTSRKTLVRSDADSRQILRGSRRREK